MADIRTYMKKRQEQMLLPRCCIPVYSAGASVGSAGPASAVTK